MDVVKGRAAVPALGHVYVGAKEWRVLCLLELAFDSQLLAFRVRVSVRNTFYLYLLGSASLWDLFYTGELLLEPSGMCPCHGRGWNWRVVDVPSSPNHSRFHSVNPLIPPATFLPSPKGSILHSLGFNSEKAFSQLGSCCGTRRSGRWERGRQSPCPTPAPVALGTRCQHRRVPAHAALPSV